MPTSRGRGSEAKAKLTRRGSVAAQRIPGVHPGVVGLEKGNRKMFTLAPLAEAQCVIGLDVVRKK